MAERISDLSGNIYDQLREKAKHFRAYSVALDESTDITYTDDGLGRNASVIPINWSKEATSKLESAFFSTLSY